MAGEHSGHRQRMRDRAINEGLMGFHDHELLELLLYPFIPYRDTNSIAHDLLREFHSLEGVFEADAVDLLKVKGMTENAAFYISMMPDIFRKYNLSKLDKKPVLDTTDKIVNQFSPLLSTLTKEAVYMMCLDNRNALLSMKCVTKGVVNEAYLHTRDIVEEAIKRNAVNVIIAHNHPSGNPHPSRNDLNMTSSIRNALDSIGIGLIDHIIIAGNRYYSFRRHGGFELMEHDYLLDSSRRKYDNDGYDELFDLTGIDIDYGAND